MNELAKVDHFDLLMQTLVLGFSLLVLISLALFKIFDKPKYHNTFLWKTNLITIAVCFGVLFVISIGILIYEFFSRLFTLLAY